MRIDKLWRLIEQITKGLKENKKTPGGACHHKAVVQCRGQRERPEQALGHSPALKIS
jgi:hypothetical protein